MRPIELLKPEQRRVSKTYLVNDLRKAVYSWREQGYPNTTDTTRRLLQFWFEEQHEDLFEFWFCQREAIETLIYMYEVIKKRNFIDMAKEFGSGPIQGYDPTYDKYPLYAFKMATGSGKTFVMTLSIVWSYFNYKREDKEAFASRFLLIAGEKNVIYDRLKRDFQDEKIFKELPLIPPEWKDQFDLKVILKEDPIHVIPEGVLFLTNIQQLEEKKNKTKETEKYVNEVMELKSVYNVSDIYQENRIREVLTSCSNIMILKDEAHHIYHLEKAWKKILLDLNNELEDKYDKGINMELDFSATPKTGTGALFPWTVVDFPLKEAIEMNIVKLPLKGMVKEAQEIASDKTVERYRAWIDAGIRRWREYKNNLKPLKKEPILFFQCPANKKADEIYEYLNTAVPDLKGKVLLIHTDSTGSILKKDLEPARDAARYIDEPEKIKQIPELKERFPEGINAIVSTMMLNEGWDVRNVNVIVGLRPYTSEREVLPEQVIGRGLRKMFPEEVSNVERSINVLEVIGPPGLINILEELEVQEGIKFAEFDTDKSISMTTVYVDENKLDKDIEIPILSPRILIKEFLLNEVDIDNLDSLSLPIEDKVLKTKYVAVDMLDGMEVIEREWTLPVPQSSQGVISYYTNQITKELKLGGVFSTFYPLVKKYVIEKLFKEKVDLDDPRLLFNLSSTSTQTKLVGLFVASFRDRTFIEKEPQKIETKKLSKVSPFVTTKLVYPANKSVFNYVPCDSNFEIDFAKFLDSCEDVEAFSKIVVKIGFSIEYVSDDNLRRYYYPDFVVKSTNGEYYLIETKGLIDLEVAHKDKRAKQWCKDASNLTGDKWEYYRIDQDNFEKYRFKSLEELCSSEYYKL